MNSQLLVSWFYVTNNKIYIANIFHLIKRFAVLLYVSTSTSSSVNKCRKQLFFKKGRLPVGITPTTDAL